jgi:hypothetical protein
MPSTSQRQARFMAACAHGAGYESCPPQKVSTEFNQADKGTRMLSQAMKKRKRFQFGGMTGWGGPPRIGGAAPMMQRGPMPMGGGQNLAQMLAALRARGGVGGMAGGFGLGNMLGSGQIRPPTTGGGMPPGASIGRPMWPGPGAGMAGGMSPIRAGGLQPPGMLGGMTPQAPISRPPISGGGGPMAGVFGPGMMMGSGPVPQAPATTPPGLVPPRLPATTAQPGGLGMLGRLGMGGVGAGRFPMMNRMARGGPLVPPGGMPSPVSPLQSLISGGMSARQAGPPPGRMPRIPTGRIPNLNLGIKRSRVSTFPVARGGSIMPRRLLPERGYDR